jgi:hypothetical protein
MISSFKLEQIDDLAIIGDWTYKELIFKIDMIIEYLKDNGGENYELYNHTCPAYSDEPDSNIVEYAEDIKKIIDDLKNPPDTSF